MAIRLFAHTLMRSPATSSGDPWVTLRPLDFGRWVLGELVARRGEPIAWCLQPPVARRRVPARSEALAADSIWADTQPWWHE